MPYTASDESPRDRANDEGHNLAAKQGWVSFGLGKDLASVSQVNQSFLASALPRLYRSLPFYHNQAKRYPRVGPFIHTLFITYASSKILTPFAVVKAHPHLAAHVQTIEFITSFTCTVVSAVPPLLPFIQSKPRLHTLRIEARLTEEQTKLLCQLRELQNVTLENASSAVIDALPKWVEALKPTLEHLTIHTSPYLNRTVLQRTLEHLPKLRGLHIIGCLRVTHVDVLSVTEHTPLLQSLAFTVMETDFTSNLPRTSLTALKHLAVELMPSLRLSDQQTFPTTLIDEIVEMHGTHLRCVRFMGFTLNLDGLENLMECEGLEKLAISVPADDIYAFSSVLSGNATLHTLIDVVEHGTHGKRKSLTTDSVGVLLEEVPCLTRVVSENRLWTSRQTPHGPESRLERMKSSRGTRFWFTPPAEVRCI
ncbi:hypothetical protein BGW80DRAFT_1445030 [Lactifluus volemus]|nr:hypothetical protein BGW80DRAFT_1445030 [Lactifluus volemus]